MNRKEAIIAMLNGCKVTYKGCTQGYAYYKDEDYPFWWCFEDELVPDQNINGLWYSDEWELYKQPEPKYKWLYRVPCSVLIKVTDKYYTLKEGKARDFLGVASWINPI